MKRLVQSMLAALALTGALAHAQAPMAPYTLPATGAVSRTVVDRLADQKDVFDFMSPAEIADVRSGTHAIDDSAAIQAALNAGGLIKLGAFNYRLAHGITVPVGSFLTSGDGMSGGAPSSGAKLTCDLSVVTCVTVGGANARNGGAGLMGVTVTRAAGTPPAGSIGVLVWDVYNPTLSYINSIGHAIGFYFKGDPTGSGISAQPDHLFSGGATDAHLVLDTWPELRISDSRFGQNGPGDRACRTYIRITGGSTTGAAEGPNTLYVVNTQFNQGTQAAAHWLEFVHQMPGSIADIGEWSFDNVHVEAIGSTYLYSDSSWPRVSRLKISNAHFNDGAEFDGLDAATRIAQWQISNSFFAGAFTVAPAHQIDFLQMANNHFVGNVSFVGPSEGAQSGSVLSLSNNIYEKKLSFAGTFGKLNDIGDTVIAGPYTDTSVGNVGPSVKQILLAGTTTDTSYTFSGTADSAGNLSLAHGLANPQRKILSATAWYKDPGGAVHPATVNFVDGTNINVSAGGHAAGRPMVVHLVVGATILLGF
jgi:hypothetical protein